MLENFGESSPVLLTDDKIFRTTCSLGTGTMMPLVKESKVSKVHVNRMLSDRPRGVCRVNWNCIAAHRATKLFWDCLYWIFV